MWKSSRLLVVTLVLVLSGADVGAADAGAANPSQAQQKILLETIRANRKGLVAVNLELSAEEANKFWPLYDRYVQETNAIGDRVSALVDEYIASFRDLANDRALQLMEGYLTGEAERVQVRRSYLAEFAKILPGRKVARFYQIENKMDAILRYELASTIPVIDEERAAPAK